jgi:hypothetical protein
MPADLYAADVIVTSYATGPPESDHGPLLVYAIVRAAAETTRS